MSGENSIKKPINKASQLVLVVVLIATVVIVGSVMWWFIQNTGVDSETINQPTTIVDQSSVEPDESEEEIIEKEIDSVFDKELITNTLETWVASTAGQSSVVIADIDGNVIASIEPDRSYFAASIYKLYVAYEGYIQIDKKVVDPDELYINGHTRSECLFLMINESDSPCAEKLWSELGKEAVTRKLQEYGLKNTSMTSLTTTASDAAIMLSRIARGEGLTSESQAKYLLSMETQIYRDALNEGFSDVVTVYNKIGFNEKVEYHDVAIVKFSDGRQMVISVLTEKVGTKNIAKLATAIESALFAVE